MRTSEDAAVPALSPNRRARREHIIEATMRVLRSRGLAGCTSRAIAESGGLSKSALHYYFRDTEEIVEVAFRRLMGRFFERVKAAADSASEPLAALRAAASTYLHLGSSRHSSQVPMLWFEVQLAASRCGDTATVHELTERMIGLFGELVGGCGAPDPVDRARILLGSLVGILARDAMSPLDLDAELDVCLRVIGLDRADA